MGVVIWRDKVEKGWFEWRKGMGEEEEEGNSTGGHEHKARERRHTTTQF